jgi:teichuronic acid biosynthesis glycosyltransferase TuaG
MALVSVVTPAWNAAAFVAETIASVRAQTLGDWEMWVVDDASTDDTAAMVERAAQDDRRVRLVRQPANAGPARARQAALDRATGRFVAFLDADDLWLPAKLERQTAFARERRAALSYTSFRRISEDGAVVGARRAIPPSLSHAELLRNTAIATLTAMVDREVAGPIAMTDTGYDDLALWLSILRRGHVAHGLDEDLARYRVRRASVSSRRLRAAGWVWRIYREQEGLSVPRASWCLAQYGARAWLKRQVF